MMTEETRDKYLQIAKMLDSNPVGAPNSKEFMEMLTIMFPEGRPLDLALLLSFKTQTLGEIAEKAGLPENEVKETLEYLAARGCILGKSGKDGTRKYRLWPTYAGYYEYMNASETLTKEEHERLDWLWKMYYKKTMIHEVGETEPGWHRVMPVPGSYMDPDTILPYESARNMLEKDAKKLALMQCACRKIESERNVKNRPLDTCIACNEAAAYAIEYGLGKEITIDEAMDVLKRTEEAGCVHTTANNKDNLLFICNCDGDCCLFFRPYNDWNYPGTIGKASVWADVDQEACIGCGVCKEDRCPVHAIELTDGKADVNKDRCIGCGLCVTKCPAQAITLVKRPEEAQPVVPETLGELSKIIWKTKKKNREDPKYVR